MTTGTVVANAGTHRILEALASGPKGTYELKRIVGAVNSVSRFEGEYMARMVQNGYAYGKGMYWYITKAGRRKYAELGPVHEKAMTAVALPRTPLEFTAFKSIYDKPQPVRAGSMEFAKLPSRIGDKLYYPDGRIVDIGEKDGS